VAARRDRIGPLLVSSLGVAVLAPTPFAWAEAPATLTSHEASPPEVIVNATRLADEALTAKVVQVLKDDPYIYANHINVVTENGVVRLQGVVLDLYDLRRALALARRAAGKRRVLNEIEFIPADHDTD
jgi:hypothetical protein